MLAGNTQTEYGDMGFSNPLFLDIQERLLQIKALSEDSKNRAENLKEINVITKCSLQSIEYALFAIRANQTQLPLTTFSASAVAHRVKSELSVLARVYGVELCLDSSPKLDPIFANEMAVRGSLYGLVATLLLSNVSMVERSKIIIAVQQTATTTQRIGAYSSDIDLNLSAMKRSINMAHVARMPMSQSTSKSTLGIQVANQLVTSLDSELQQFRHKTAKGIGFYVPMSAQLSLV